MKKPSYTRYKRYEREEKGMDLVEWLIKTKPKFKRGMPGRKTRPHKWVRSSVLERGGKIDHVSNAIYEAWYGKGLNYDVCDQLARAFRLPTNENREKCQMIVCAYVLKAMNSGFSEIFSFLEEHMYAVSKAPVSPLHVAVGLAFFNLRKNWNSEKTPNLARWVEEAEKMFEETKYEKPMLSLRGTLFRTINDFLKKLPLK